MTNKEKAPEGQTSEAPQYFAFTNNSDCKNNTKVPRINRGTKEYKVLSALAEGRSFNRFQAV